MVGLNGNPDREVLPCAEGVVSLICTITVPQNIDIANIPLFRLYYGLTYPFSGFLAPVNPAPTVNLTRAGASVPLKFSLGGDLGLNILAAGSPTSVPIACDASSPQDEVDVTVASSTSGLHYDSDANQYVYVWKTQKTWAGTCREFQLTLNDGAPAKTATFQFTK